jgi:glycosyltransferase involved in cell wall biosynthesis
MSIDSRSVVSVIVLTFNESRNLDACLRSVTGWARDVVVVDSGSTDDTVAIAQGYRAQVVTHPFETHAKQWQWALRSVPLETEWVLALDADQQVSLPLREAILAALAVDPPVNGYFVNRRQIFRGRWIRHGGYYPKYLLKLFRRGAASVDDGDLVDHHFAVTGATGILREDLIEDNRNEAAIAEWTSKHNRYAVLQARQEWQQRRAGGRVPIRAAFGHPDDRVRWLKQQWAGLPLFVRPCLYVFYRYVLRLGFLDGREGFQFHVLQGFWYRLLVDVNIDELNQASGRQATVSLSASDRPPQHEQSGDDAQVHEADQQPRAVRAR